MRKIALGNTGLWISPLVYGTLPMGPLQAALAPAEGGRLIRHALERGVNLVDTAELYGTYAHLRAGLEGFSGEVHVATKTHAAEPAQARQHVERALRELGRPLAVVHVHGARVSDPFRERRAVIDELLRLKEQGKFRLLGLSSHYVSSIRAAAASAEIDVVHPLVNRVGLGIRDGTPADMAAAIAAAADAGKGVYAMKALAGGSLIAEARASLAYVLGLHGVHAVAVGMLSLGEVDANVELLAGNPGDEGRWRELEARRRRLTIMEGFCKGCGACVDACTNDALTLTEVEGRPVARADEEKCVLCGYCAAACPEFVIRVV